MSSTGGQRNEKGQIDKKLRCLLQDFGPLALIVALGLILFPIGTAEGANAPVETSEYSIVLADYQTAQEISTAGELPATNDAFVSSIDVDPGSTQPFAVILQPISRSVFMRIPLGIPLDDAIEIVGMEPDSFEAIEDHVSVDNRFQWTDDFGNQLILWGNEGTLVRVVFSNSNARVVTEDFESKNGSWYQRNNLTITGGAEINLVPSREIRELSRLGDEFHFLDFARFDYLVFRVIFLDGELRDTRVLQLNRQHSIFRLAGM
jgi:hypothetical protein